MTRTRNAALTAAVLVPLFASAFGACSHNATFRLRNGSKIVGRAKSHTATRVYVDTEAGSVPVNRCEIAAVSHPGRGTTITGLALAVPTGLIAAAVADGKGSEALVAAIPFSVAAGLAIWGISTWSSSASNAGSYPLKCSESQRSREGVWDDVDIDVEESDGAADAASAENPDDVDGVPATGRSDSDPGSWQADDPADDPLLPDTY